MGLFIYTVGVVIAGTEIAKLYSGPHGWVFAGAAMMVFALTHVIGDAIKEGS